MDAVQQRPRTPTSARNPGRHCTQLRTPCRPGGSTSCVWVTSSWAVGLAIKKWPELLAHEPWELKHGTVLTMLVAMSVLALLGLRYPQRMLPILLFEVAWKLIWLGVVALPLWLDDNLTGGTRVQTGAVLWVVIIIAVVPWRHVVRQFVIARGERWR